MLRAAAKTGSALGLQAAELMAAGKLVPDDLIIGIVKERLSQSDCRERGWLLDGFPRTAAQAEALTKMGITPDAFVYLNVPDEILVERYVYLPIYIYIYQMYVCVWVFVVWLRV